MIDIYIYRERERERERINKTKKNNGLLMSPTLIREILVLLFLIIQPSGKYISSVQLISFVSINKGKCVMRHQKTFN